MSGKTNKPEWEGKGYAFFQNRACEYFPCHPMGDEENFNCLFCYCPLYALGDPVRGELSVFGVRVQGLQRVPVSPPAGELRASFGKVSADRPIGCPARKKERIRSAEDGNRMVSS